MNNIFEISNLNCAYKSNKIVLQVKNLVIPFGKIIFIVGKSGIGKSTILETLGLMNNTILTNADSKIQYCATPESKPIDIVGLWKDKNDKKISQFRLHNFSFIFQQTNLMRNFTAFENVAITRMLQGDSKENCYKKTEEVLTILMDEKINQKREVYEFSGGQQQRLSFARAIVPEFSVLFGDEPTGNLDPTTAEDVMGVLCKALNSKEHSSAIIVSHSIDLAVKFADIIIKIHSKPRENDPKKLYGYIDDHSIYNKDVINNDWTMSDQKTIGNKELISILGSNGKN